MSEYKGIQGFTVQSLNQEVSKAFPGAAANLGQIWYSPNGNFYLQKNIVTGGSWTTVNSMNTGRGDLAGAGTQTSALAFGGVTPAPAVSTATEKYDGTNWSSNPTGLNTARNALAGCGTQTSALAFGGFVPPATRSNATEKFNGTSWTSVNNMNTGRRYLAGCGTQTSALAFGGNTTSTPPSQVVANTEKYDGTNWTAGNTMNTARKELGGAGIQTAALAFGGAILAPPISFGASTAATEKFNGTTWTTVNSMNTARAGLAGVGTETAALAFSSSTEKYDGTNWTTVTSMNTNRPSVAGAAGTLTAALAFGGSPGTSTATEEWDGAFSNKITIT
jgi:hypothetical protein